MYPLRKAIQLIRNNAEAFFGIQDIKSIVIIMLS